MSRTTLEPYDPCADPNSRSPSCARPQLERLRFWDGRFLVARDLRDQQKDLIRRLEYHQSFAHGEGILCGFEIREHPREKCRDRYLVVDPGMAYDCCGRTLWMPDCRVVEIPRPNEDADETKESGPAQAQQEPALPNTQHGHTYVESPADEGAEYATPDAGEQPIEGQYRDAPHPEGERPPLQEWFIVACHVECNTDPVPALYADDLCEPMREEYGRVREDVALRVVAGAEISEICWPRYRPVKDVDCTQLAEDDCDYPLGETQPCARECACGDCVVLARVWRDRVTGRLHWSTTHRKVLAPPVNLTKITGTSWPHGGELSTRQLREQHNGQLIVRFSRQLKPANGLRNGINMMTFTVSFLGATRNFEQIIPPEPNEQHGRPQTPRLSHNRRCAIFDIDPDQLRGRIGYGGSFIHIRLLCDFLIDCHGRAVSGAHIAGDANRRGSGNGAQGGVFESWFYLRPSARGDLP